MPSVDHGKALELAIRMTFQRAANSSLLEGHCVFCGDTVRINYELASQVVKGEDVVACRMCCPSRGPSKGSVLTPRQRCGLKRTDS